MRLTAFALALCGTALPALAEEVNIYSHRQPELIQPLVGDDRRSPYALAEFGGMIEVGDAAGQGGRIRFHLSGPLENAAGSDHAACMNRRAPNLHQG